MTDEPRSLEAIAEQAEALVHLRQANARLSRQLAEAKAARAELVAAVRQAAFDAATGLVIPPVPAPKPDRRTRRAEVALCVFSDWQLGKVTPDYSSEVCEQRVERYVDKVLQLADIQRKDHPVEICHVASLGDFCEGRTDFPRAGAPHRRQPAGAYPGRPSNQGPPAPL